MIEQFTGHTVLVEPVSFFLDNIDLRSMMVCGLPALPHNPVQNQMQDGVIMRASLTLPIRCLFLLLPKDVRTIFLEGSAKIWVDECMHTEFRQQSSHQIGPPHEFLLFHIRGGVRFLGVSLV